MQLCPNCQTQNRPGVFFCERCGFALEAVSISTKQLGDEDQDHAAGSEHLSNESVIFLHIRGFDDPLTLKIKEELVLGREGTSSSTGAPFLSLEPYGASDAGVSRNHAQLTRMEDQLLLRDLESTNYTHLNGQRLSSNRDYSLRDGDEISLGRLVMRVFFK